MIKRLIKRNKRKSIKSNKSLIKKVSFETLFKNINSVCGPEVLRQAVPQSGAIITKSPLPCVFNRTRTMVKRPVPGNKKAQDR